MIVLKNSWIANLSENFFSLPNLNLRFNILIYDGLSIILQTQQQSCPIADWQPRKSEVLGGLDLVA